MQDQNNNKLNKAMFLLLQPLARLFLRFGKGYREYSDLSKAAFVAVAAKDYGVHGRPTNVSRIAAMTGLTRKEISRIRDKIAAGEVTISERGTPLQEVISAWRSNDEFLDEHGQAEILPLSGERSSFHSLIRRFAGDIPEGAMRKELCRIGAAEIVGETIRLKSTMPDTAQAEENMARQLQAGPIPLLAALATNESAYAGSAGWPLEIIRRHSIRKSDVRRVRTLVSVRLRAATTNIADLLDAYATIHDGEGMDEPMVAVSAGVFYAEGLDVNDE